MSSEQQKIIDFQKKNRVYEHCKTIDFSREKRINFERKQYSETS